MDFYKAIILGIIQGLTEFLPISSSAHLVIFPKILNWPYWGKTFDTFLHFGTFLALIIYFWKDLIKIIKGFFNSIKDKNLSGDFYKKLPYLLIITAIPGALFGFFFEDFLEEKMSQLLPIGIMLIIFSIILWVADYFGKKTKEIKEVSWLESIIIGISQALALMPGVSRSGITMTAGLFMNFKRKTAAEFSFLASIPIVGGAAIYKIISTIKEGIDPHMMGIILVGLIASFLSGYFAIKFLLKYLEKGSFLIFVVYRILLGIFLLVWFFTH